MKICRFKDRHGEIRVGLVADDNALLDLTPVGIVQLHPLLESDDAVSQLNQIGRQNLPRIALSEVQLCAPVERQEVWAAGVTYLRSKAARMEESDFSASAYDRVYAAERPEIFFKALAEKVAATDERFSFMYTIEWEMPYFNMGSTFDYAEMTYLMIPRPFMVERGHHDRVGRDQWVAHEYAKVRWLYTQLGLADRTAIEYFNGGHTINGQGTFEFLHKYLNWPLEQ